MIAPEFVLCGYRLAEVPQGPAVAEPEQKFYYQVLITDFDVALIFGSSDDSMPADMPMATYSRSKELREAILALF